MRRDERGVAVVETAVVLTLLLLLAFGAAEYGLMWRDMNRVEHALQSSGRVGSNVADQRLADYHLLRSLDAGLEGLAGADVERVVVYEASATDAEVPPTCLTVDVEALPLSRHGVADTCNVYSPQQLANAASTPFSGTTSCDGGAWDADFCPTTRTRGSADATYLGVAIRLRYSAISGLVIGDLTVDRSTVYRLEPCVPSLETC